jgi:hypothetical protein
MVEYKNFNTECCGDPEYLILDDVSLRAYFNVSARTTAEWRRKGLITYSRIGNKVYYRYSDVAKMLDNFKFPSKAEQKRFNRRI